MADFDKAIPPGQEGRITLKVDTKNKKGRLKQIATIFSNDPQNPITKVSTIVSIKQYFDFEPSNRVLLQGYYGDTITKNVTITSHADQAVTIKSISSDIDSKIEYKLNTIKEGKEFGLKIKTRSGLQDVFRGKIILKTTARRNQHSNLL